MTLPKLFFCEARKTVDLALAKIFLRCAEGFGAARIQARNNVYLVTTRAVRYGILLGVFARAGNSRQPARSGSEWILLDDRNRD
jgi:hypothetical protein